MPHQFRPSTCYAFAPQAPPFLPSTLELHKHPRMSVCEYAFHQPHALPPLLMCDLRLLVAQLRHRHPCA
eukprot:1156960-Pelagomonas_calceolata.AAC.3